VYSSVEGPADSDNKTIVFLVRTKDGIHYEDVAKIDVPGFPNETAVYLARIPLKTLTAGRP
ncbi:MAG: hypothetical protein J6P56_02695, partial [Bacteroidales bacterium]|nr:hypothetical protein [Bacteroidales bacterium]